MQDNSILREVLDSRREALKACAYWRSINTNEAGRRLAEFELLIVELDKEIDQAIESLSLSEDPRTTIRKREKE